MMIACSVASIMPTSHASALERVISSDQVAYRVRFEDLDPATNAGAMILYRRISAAAARACETLSSAALQSVPRVRRCIAQSTARAVAGVNTEAMTRQLQKRSSHSIVLARK
jgi:UrcA family protein